jgi:hypothetical protein
MKIEEVAVWFFSMVQSVEKICNLLRVLISIFVLFCKKFFVVESVTLVYQ